MGRLGVWELLQNVLEVKLGVVGKMEFGVIFWESFAQGGSYGQCGSIKSWGIFAKPFSWGGFV